MKLLAQALRLVFDVHPTSFQIKNNLTLNYSNAYAPGSVRVLLTFNFLVIEIFVDTYFLFCYYYCLDVLLYPLSHLPS